MHGQCNVDIVVNDLVAGDGNNTVVDALVQHCIISKDADLTVAFRVELPELFTVTSAEYEAIHSAWYKAVKVLPDYSIVHKQDFFIKENYPSTLSSIKTSTMINCRIYFFISRCRSSQTSRTKIVKNERYSQRH